eukprot:12562582-Ditylum_brightwellii.AAC.1
MQQSAKHPITGKETPFPTARLGYPFAVTATTATTTTTAITPIQPLLVKGLRKERGGERRINNNQRGGKKKHCTMDSA